MFMQRIISIILCILLVGCVSADPRRTNYSISISKYEWNYDNPLSFENELLAIRLIASKNSASVFDFITGRYVVMSESSAKKYLSNHYDICLIEVANKTNAEEIFYLNRLHLVYKDQDVSLISSVDLPSVVNRINPNGISKNIYNAIAIITITTAVVALVVLSHGHLPLQGDSIPWPSAGPQKSDKESSKLEKEQLWSSLYHDTQFQYEDIIIDENPIASYSHKSGIVFIPKGKLKFDNHLKMIYD
jgi:hypothetical protein